MGRAVDQAKLQIRVLSYPPFLRRVFNDLTRFAVNLPGADHDLATLMDTRFQNALPFARMPQALWRNQDRAQFEPFRPAAQSAPTTG